VPNSHLPVPLNNATLAAVGHRVSRPEYDRSALVPTVVHLGVGGFHRAHQAVYLDDLARRGDPAWGEVGVGLRSRAMRDVLAPQDWMYTVVERGRGGDTARIVGSMIDYQYAPDDPEAVVARLADARTRVVTLTITGGGYPIGEDGRFLADDPAVRSDLAQPGRPVTAFGYLVAALGRRRAVGGPGCTVLSCDNLPSNGTAARTATLGLARAWNAALAEWIDEHVSFPSSMVDRITPATDLAARRLVSEKFGVADRWPVITEPFRQWVIEDDFANGRPPLDRVGAQFVRT
jgi:mannitol 2-dehydrogenase